MKKNKIVAGLIGTAFVGSVLIHTGGTASAATFNGSSDASVSFKSGSLITPPITPPVVPPVTPPASDFGLLHVPKEFNFQETAVPAATVTANTSIPIDSNWEGSPASDTSGAGGTNPTTKHVGVGDVRGKRAAGWKLEAKLSSSLASGAKQLTGATIQMGQTLNELNPTTWAQTPTAVGSGVHAPDTVPTSVTISTASSVVASASAETASGAADGRGEGYWETEYTNINLVVPAAAMNSVTAGEQYSGTVDWTLTDAI
ncbi:WxL domain-containing protein [Candidatus Enterococcus murrayae]|uniref:WxL domain-containing protein n=1 Tax=Candidatus Enterococcus murrayae TaxID=2815321 RepID=A0ABS3HIF8_9ENTE|nr:WxL domain-containing protein [Enterococcus sp. MJM16]MBO0452670.1 WxL domain-containing protein [Enterococcus sp. MJM16]